MSLAKSSYKHCYLCETALNVGAVPLFVATRNKEFIGKGYGTTESIILSDLTKSVGINQGINIDSAAASLPSVCKKCARKIFNCCTLFHELEGEFLAKTEAVQSSQGEAIDLATKRVHSTSPSGLTPHSKKAKDISLENSSTKGKARKTLFELNSARSDEEKLEDAVANLMCLSVTKTDSPSSVVKVRSYLFFSFDLWKA